MTEALKGRAWVSLAVLLVVLIICNLGFAKSNGWARWGWQVFGFVGLFSAFWLGGLTLSDIGLSRSKLGAGVKYALVAIFLISIVLLIVYLINSNIFRDKRYDQPLGTALTAGLLLLPLKVVLFEELAFRGIMPALLKDLGSKPWAILLISSVLFGLWHILTAPKSSSLTVSGHSNLIIIFTIFMATFAGGVALYLLRQYSDSLVSSIMVHWFVNCSVMILAALSWVKH
ncbi:CPBP family intramembrane metalloprotease [Candidatus Saccharibacteria bacterium]|nr:CPBP family intramembrane metalloprotease [Candidatus Saccharibacteria bacterium]